ncbi:hypothetical protein [[Eubacterium] hominis]|uniref:hypothetical protein n=1 Tax=[Eubacterium] hominis TaxID=2764325 RepID=UPI003A4D9E1D
MAIGINVLIQVSFLVGLVLLQRYLVKQESKWLGWIMPMIFFLLSCLVVLGSLTYSNHSTTAMLDEAGNIIEESVVVTKQPWIDQLLPMISLFLMYNVPTIVFSAMCIVEHRKDKGKQQLNKMSIQDL